MKIVRYLFFILARAINYLTPKDKRKVMFASYPDMSDNARALYDFMINRNEFNGWTFVWIVDSVRQSNRDDTIFISKPVGAFDNSYLKYLYHLITSKYLFCTHSSFVEAVPSRQISVLLWHGTMLKRICAMNEREKKSGRKRQFRFFVSASKFYVKYYSQSFLCPENRVIPCGYPRNDVLFQESEVLEKLGIETKSYQKVIVYMPTFRTPKGGGYSDAENGHNMCIDITDSETISRLSSFFYDNRLLLIIKWHPSDIRQTIAIQTDNIKSVRNVDLDNIGMQVYHLLHKADALITDYSSVFCDYLILDRPIAFDLSDIESYSENRGFVYDNPLDYMPGYKLFNENDFLSFCKEIAIGIDSTQDERKRLKNVYNDYFDSNNCFRLLNKVGLL